MGDRLLLRVLLKLGFRFGDPLAPSLQESFKTLEQQHRVDPEQGKQQNDQRNA